MPTKEAVRLVRRMGTGRRCPMVKEPIAQESLADLLQEWGNLLRSLAAGTSLLAQEQPARMALQKLCDVLASASPHIRLVWIHGGDVNREGASSVCVSGVVSGQSASLLGRDHGYLGPSPMCQPAPVHYPIVTRIRGGWALGPQRSVALGCGLEQSAVFPFRVAGSQANGVLTVYADRLDYFERVGLEAFMAFSHLAAAATLQDYLKRRL